MTANHIARVTAVAAVSWSLAATSQLDAQEMDFVFISNVTGTMVNDRSLTTIEDQTERTLERLGAMLRERGLSYGSVVVANVFLRDTRHFQAMNAVYRRYFQNDPPARATVQIDLPNPDALIQMSVVATPGTKQIVTPRGMKSPALPYSWGIKVGNTLFIAGMTSRSPETYQPVTGDLGTQTRRIFGNIGLVLQEAGMDYGDLVSCRVFLGDARRFGAMNLAYRGFVPAEDPPARATVRAGLMNPLFDAEIQCVAESSRERRVVVGEGRRRSRSPFAPAISTGDRLYLAGMVGSGPDGVPPDIAGQTRNALENLRATLLAANMDFGNVVDMWIYVTDIRQWDAVKGVLEEVLPDGAPEATVIGTPLMGSSLLVEIQMIARR